MYICLTEVDESESAVKIQYRYYKVSYTVDSFGLYLYNYHIVFDTRSNSFLKNKFHLNFEMIKKTKETHPECWL